ncbi:MAG TPA: TetR/AcrR family transcriptional regulator [Actinophytocola sp.]|uniref:TetR/AcrR family transcriptional regulator n=1 Tax=Actinophytocola sp. TaxID=1872138 RepID=UPI002DBD7FC7|nr:TetR/AcrR family transcriptional regulator [Actinophytocola sp.]HEU5473485.1 TetR/AcrR family transcriptional regulator [Actinophytocola sp.]
MSPKQSRGEQTARRLLDAALEVHERTGPAGFTVPAVTAASGISLGSLYHHFGSFDGLAAALYQRCMAELLDAIVAALERSRTARTGVRAVVLAYLRFVEEHPAQARFIHASAHAGYLPAHAAAIAAAKAPRIERMLAWLAPHVRAGRIVDLPGPLIEMLLIGPVAELSRRWLAGAPDLDPRTAARLLPDRIWRSVSAS